MDGPFALTTPRNLIQTGIAKIPKPVKKAHWPGLLGGMLLLLGLCLLLLVSKAYEEHLSSPFLPVLLVGGLIIAAETEVEGLNRGLGPPVPCLTRKNKHKNKT